MAIEFSTLNELFLANVDRFGERPALKLAPSGERGLGAYKETSYSELGELAARCSGALERLGVTKGDRVALISKPRLEWQIGLWGALRLGAIVVPIDTELTPAEIRRILRESEARVAIVDAKHLQALRALQQELSKLEQVIPMDRSEEGSLWTLLERAEPRAPVEIKPDDLALIVYTSGTTGNAKGVMLSHYNLAFDVQAFLEGLDVTADDVALSIIPWHHIFGFTATILGPLCKGAMLIYTDDYKLLPQLMPANRVTILIGVPKLFNAMFQKIEERLGRGTARLVSKLSPGVIGRKLREGLTGEQFRFFVSGGAPLDPRTIVGFRRLGFGVIEGYGLTETSPVVSYSTPFNDKPGSVGPPIPGVEVRIAEPNEEGIGEILVRGPNVMQGYYKNPERTKEVLDEGGWFHTGDLGKLDEENWLYIKGRKKNVIVLENGKNVYPEEVEFELGRSRYIEDILIKRGYRGGKEVVQALVYPDWERLKREGIASERLTEGEIAKVKELLWREISTRGRNLAPYKRVKSREDIMVLSEPFEKTNSQDIKRYLYLEEGSRVGG